jgi:hypothetical protein
MLAAAVAITFAMRAATRLVHVPLGELTKAPPAVQRTVPRDAPGFFTGVADRQRPADEPLPPPARLHADRVRPLRASYESWYVSPDGVPVRSEGRSAIEVAATAVDGVPAWRVVRALRVGAGTGRFRAETAYVAVADLRLLGRTEHARPYRGYDVATIRQRVSDDSLVGSIRLGDGRARRIRRRLAAAARPYLSDAFAPLLFTAVPLHRSWSGSVSLVRWGVADDDVVSRVALRVIGEERVTVPAGTFDCWRLTVTTDGRTLSHWVRKSDGLGVKVSEPGHEVVLATEGR